jgi:methylmalonyl-CoA mutase cobalamin-binding subunit
VRGDLTVAEEHVATATLQRALALVAESIPVSPHAPRCLLACAEGDDHTLGLSLADVCLREAGWRSEWVGRSTRRSDVCERVRTGAVQMVGLSASASAKDGRQLRGQARTIADACRAAGVPLVMGGSGAWPESPTFGVRVKRCEEFDALLRTTVVPHPAA